MSFGKKINPLLVVADSKADISAYKEKKKLYFMIEYIREKQVE